MLQLANKPHNGGAKDGEAKMSLGASSGTAGLHARNRRRLTLLLTGMLFACGCRTVTTWLRAAGISTDDPDYYYFLAPLGRKSGIVATRLLALVLRTLPLPHPHAGTLLPGVIDDSPANRFTRMYKMFLATYRPVRGRAPPRSGGRRVVLVREDHGWFAFFSTDPRASVQEILEAFADRAANGQDFHEIKEVWDAGQQQVRNIWTNVAVFNLNLWVHTLVEGWAWHKSAEEICDRSASPWDDPERRPSHADRRKALRRQTLRNEYSSLSFAHRLSSKIRSLHERLLQLAA